MACIGVTRPRALPPRHTRCMVQSTIRNLHERRFAADPRTVGDLLASIGSPEDRLWPRKRWPAIRMARPITVGDAASHGRIRYRVDDYRPGEALWFRLDASTGLAGRHGFEIVPDADGMVVFRHTIEAHPVGSGRISWPLMLRPLHDQLMEELLDNAERLLPGGAVPLSMSGGCSVNGRSRWGRALRSGLAAANRLRKVPERGAFAIAVSGLAVAGALHVYWALGGTWPGVDRMDLAQKVVESQTLPSDAATWAVAGLLGSATALTVAGRGEASDSAIDKVATAGLGTVGCVLAVRAVAGAAISGSMLLAGRRDPYVTRDLLIYSPLCAVLGTAVGALAVRRIPRGAV